MSSNLTRYSRYLAFFILILAILYQYEVPSDISTSDNSTFLLTKTAIFPRNRTFVYQIIADIQKFPLVGNLRDGLVWDDSIFVSLQWYPNVARVEHIKASARSSADLPAKEYYRLITKMAVIGSYSLPRWFWKDSSVYRWCFIGSDYSSNWSAKKTQLFRWYLVAGEEFDRLWNRRIQCELHPRWMERVYQTTQCSFPGKFVSERECLSSLKTRFFLLSVFPATIRSILQNSNCSWSTLFTDDADSWTLIFFVFGYVIG